MRRLVLGLLAAGGELLAPVPATFQPAPAGCAMAHCDGRMSDLVRLAPPRSANVAVRFHDAAPAGSGLGLGCSSNGRVAVCSYNNTTSDNVVAYRSDGSRLWTSENLLNSTAFASAPMVNSGGGVIAADDTSLIRFSATGAVIWRSATPGGIPISPVVTTSGIVVLATRGGPVSAFDSTTGDLLGSLHVRQSPGDPEYFDTLNTPCVAGNRVYISMMRRNDPDNTAWLAAVDVDPLNRTEPLSVAWHFTFGGPSGASPLCIGDTVYFDGDRAHPGEEKNPHVFAVRDEGNAGTLVWVRPLVNSVPASFAQDPRGGFWAISTGYALAERRSLQTGAVVETLNIAALVGDSSINVPYSALTIAGSWSHPVMIAGTTDRQGRTAYVIAVDLASRQLLWKVNLAPSFGNDSAPSQFPIVLDDSGKAVVVFAGRSSGAYFLAEP